MSNAVLSACFGAGQQFFDNKGVTLSGGLIYTYLAGTTTPTSTFTDSTGATPNPYPLVISSNGRLPQEVWIQNSVAVKFILCDSNNNQLQTQDFVPGINSSNVVNSEWVPGLTATYIGAASFSVAGSNVATYQVNRRIQYTVAGGTFYGTIATSSYGSGITTVTFTADTTGMDSSLSAVNYGFMSALHPSVPVIFASVTASNTWVGTQDFTGATPEVPTATTGDNSTKAASTAFVQAAAFNSSLPSQTGNAGKVPTTNGSTVSWSFLNLLNTIDRSVRGSNTVLAAVDQATFVDITSGTFSQTFTAAATLGAGWWCFLRNSGTGNIALNPISGLIDGLSSYTMYPQECRLIQCDGTNFNSIILHPYNVTFTANGTFTTPPGYTQHGGLAWSAGSSGQRTNSLSTASYGGGGGGCCSFNISSSLMGASQTVTIGVGGTVVTTVANGVAGGNTSLGSLLTIYANTSFTTGGSVLAQLTSVNNRALGFEGSYNNTGIVTDTVWGGAGICSNVGNPVAGGNSVYGGASGGCVTSSAAVVGAGISLFGGSGGAASSAASGTAGVAPGGGGGATQTGTASGAGARGEVRVWGIV